MTITRVRCDHYRIPLSRTFSDSTHGEITHFELITVRLSDADGVEGLGYTYTVGAGGGAIRALIERDLTPLISGQPAGRIEMLWERMWWGAHRWISLTFGNGTIHPARRR